jgi:hypothetical protein
MSVFKVAGLAFAAAFALAGCESMGGSGGSGGGRNLGANLNAASEVPPNNSAGRGDAEMTYDPSSKVLKYTVNYSGLSGPATAAHIHGPAASGANGGVLVPLTQQGQPVSSPITGQATLDDAKAQAIMSGQGYVNVHTAANPGGEIRGQVMAK